MTATRMPAAFFGHGSPRITFEDNDITKQWKAFAQRIPRPEAIVVVSAHWFINASALTGAAHPRTVHDFFYAPDELYAFEYPAPGNPALVERMIELVRPTWLGPDVDSWGYDHGAWSLLAHMYPEADIPVIQLAVHASMPMQYHVDLGAQLAQLRNEGVLVMGSGNVVHNGAVRSPEGRAAGLLERAEAFDAAVAKLLMSDPERAAELGEHPDYRVGAPTDDHFLPVLYLAGLAAASGEEVTPILEGGAAGRLGMAAFSIGA